MSVRLLIGDVRDQLRGLPDESVHCVVTSPPYWGLRDYGVAGQLGLETSLGEYVEVIVAVFREVRRVLRNDGTLWLNLGDSYATSVNGLSAADNKPFSTVGPIFRPENPDKNGGASNRDGLAVDVSSMLKPKDLCGIPWRVAFALQADGWYLRQDIIWSKPNPMPESVTDRCTKAHEYLFLLSKSARYYYDAEAVREPAQYGRSEEYGAKIWSRSGVPTEPGRTPGSRTVPGNGGARNKRSVWEIATAPFPEAHFATFPPAALVEPCILAGTSEKGVCAHCGAPWVRETEREGWSGRPNSGGIRGSQPNHHRGLGAPQRGNMFCDVKTIGWSASCDCEAAIVPATVLDPFGGAGTTALVADRLQRHGILIELNPAYAAMARRRIENDAGLFAEVA